MDSPGWAAAPSPSPPNGSPPFWFQWGRGQAGAWQAPEALGASSVALTSAPVTSLILYLIWGLEEKPAQGPFSE